MNARFNRINIPLLCQLMNNCEYIYHQILTLVNMNYLLDINSILVDTDFNIIQFEHKVQKRIDNINTWVCEKIVFDETDLYRVFKLKYVDISLSENNKQNKQYIIGFLNSLQIKYKSLNTDYKKERNKLYKQILKIGNYIHEDNTYNYLLIKKIHINKNNDYVATCQRSNSEIETVVIFQHTPKLISDIVNYKKEYNQLLLANSEISDLSPKKLKCIYQCYMYKHQLHNVTPLFPDNLKYIVKDNYYIEKILKTILNLKEHIN